MSELVIDETNFHVFFREVERNRPEKGDVMVVYRSMADFCSGDLKEQVVEALFEEKIGPTKAIKLMKRFGKTSNREALRVVKNVFMDLYNGMSKNMVIAKTYEFMIEIYYYTKEEFIPKDDKKWEIIKIANLDQYFAKKDINIAESNNDGNYENNEACIGESYKQ